MRLKLYKVTGESMGPQLRAGSFVLAFARARQTVHLNDVVVVDHPRYGRIIKRVVHHYPDGTLALAGDNPAQSTSTEALGPVSRAWLLGKVVWRIAGERADSRGTAHYG